jgi:hypothetical protein
MLCYQCCLDIFSLFFDSQISFLWPVFQHPSIYCTVFLSWRDSCLHGCHWLFLPLNASYANIDSFPCFLPSFSILY